MTLNEWSTYNGQKYRITYDAMRPYLLQYGAELEDGRVFRAKSSFKAVGAAKTAIDLMGKS